ncbi:MAG: hypothetical protein EBU08_21150 [Micrococcales bacterium]|jgi:hypothetical protein|nr:hypothetical protein [Micrococcales bacterium]
MDWMRDKDSFDHAHEIVKPFGVIEHVLNWCKVELRGEWRWQLLEMSSDIKPGRYIFYFDDERDYLAFLMKWS